jgi:hypothetical protein
MEGNINTEQRSFWNEQFTTVTPFSKYLALSLFLALPFIAFYLGIKYGEVSVVHYNPTIVERVFEKEVVIDSGSTTTPEVRIIIFSGVVLEGGQRTCAVDGICSTFVSEYEVIWGQGWNTDPLGKKEVVYPGDFVEVYGQVVDESTVTLYGNEHYYLKKNTERPAPVNESAGLEKILRGELMVYEQDDPGCEKDEIGRRCFKEIKLFTNSTWEYRDWTGLYDEGKVSSDTLAEFIDGVSNADLQTLEAEAQCTDEDDSTTLSFTFYTELGKAVLDACQIQGSNDSFFRTTITDILGEITAISES